MKNELRKQLREGNIVGYDLPSARGVPFIVRAMYNGGVVLQRLGGGKDERLIHCHDLGLLPVSLSIHRLKKLRFTPSGNDFVLSVCRVTPLPDNQFLVRVGMQQRTINAVHSLQNMFFRETGMEIPLPVF